MARVPLLNQRNLSEDYEYLLGDERGDINLYRSMANHPVGLKSYMKHGTVLWEEGGFDDRERELVVLGVIRALDSRYEWNIHAPLAHGVGVDPDLVRAIGREAFADIADDRDRAFAAYGYAFARGAMTDEVHDALDAAVDTETLAAVALLAGHYVAVTHIGFAFDLPLDADAFIGWEPEDDAL
jgi:4-carboxymuconolactone decarboxylase